MEMADRQGVGNETVLDVLVNGTVVLDDITMANGYSEQFSFEAMSGDEISTQWVNQVHGSGSGYS